MGMIDITGLDKAEVLLALYDGSKYQGLGILQAIPTYTLEMAREDYEKSPDKYFDYLHGKVMKVYLGKDEFDDRFYDRDNGLGAAHAVIKNLKNRLKG
jgi:hypothetical protein